ncbi:MAG TPA: hypothetical protein VLA21_05575 [Candidatus Limnocylindria bacterium]|nr:hypothetical protein [Candidatus Limnocylindria bacterium]
MRKVLMLALAAVLAVGLLSGAMAETAAPQTAQPADQAQAAVPALTEAELEALLATALEGGRTLGQAFEEINALEAFRAASPLTKVRMLQAQLWLGRITQADARAALLALQTALGGENAGNARYGFGRRNNKGFGRGGRGWACPNLDTQDGAPSETCPNCPLDPDNQGGRNNQGGMPGRGRMNGQGPMMGQGSQNNQGGMPGRGRMGGQNNQGPMMGQGGMMGRGRMGGMMGRGMGCPGFGQGQDCPNCFAQDNTPGAAVPGCENCPFNQDVPGVTPTPAP